MQRWLAPVWALKSQRADQAMLSLPERTLYALQLGVFDDGNRAAAEAERLDSLGIRCMIWQREKMRIVSSVAFDKRKLDMSSTGNQPGYIIDVTLEPVNLRLQAQAGELEDVRQLLMLPDSILLDLIEKPQKSLPELVMHTRTIAETALDAHPENQLYTQLAQSLWDWCDLMDDVLSGRRDEQVRSYAAVTICALCRELRIALISS